MNKRIEKIINQFGNILDVSTDDLLSSSRKTYINNARYIIYKILKDDLRLTYVAIGEMFSKNHASIIAGVNVVNKRIEEDEHWDKVYNRAKFQIIEYYFHNKTYGKFKRTDGNLERQVQTK